LQTDWLTIQRPNDNFCKKVKESNSADINVSDTNVSVNELTRCSHGAQSLNTNCATTQLGHCAQPVKDLNRLKWSTVVKHFSDLGKSFKLCSTLSSNLGESLKCEEKSVTFLFCQTNFPSKLSTDLGRNCVLIAAKVSSCLKLNTPLLFKNSFKINSKLSS